LKIKLKIKNGDVMADTVKNISIKYSQTGMQEMTRQVKTYNDQLGRTAIETQKLNQHGAWATVGATTKGVNTLSSTLNGVMMRFIGVNAAIGMATQAYQELRQWVDASVTSFRSFEMKMAEINSILDSTSRQTLPSLEIGITQLSVQFGKSVGDMTKGLYDIVSAAFSVEDAIGLLEVATKAAIAGVTTTTSAVNTLTGVLNAYGLSAAHAGEISDKLFQSVIRGVFTFKDLEDSLGYVTPIAANLGVSIDEVTAAMSAATRQGQHIDSVTRGLGLLMQGIVDPTKEAAEAARKYGIDMSASALRTRGLTGFLQDLSAATDKYGMQILPKLIGNMRSLRVALALTGDTGLKGFTDDMELLKTATGRTDDALASMMNTQQQMANILAQSMEKISRSIGESWSGVDIWWKKAQLWWGTLLSGGNADNAVKSFDDAVYKMRQSYIDNLVKPAATGEQTVLEKLKSGVSPTSAIPWKDISNYEKNSKEIEKYTKELNAATNAQTILANVSSDAKWKKGVRTVESSDNLTLLNEQLTTLGIKTLEVGSSTKDLNRVESEINNKLSNTTIIVEGLQKVNSELSPTIDGVKSAFQDMSSEIEDTRTNIIMLTSEVDDLNDVLNKPFKGFDNMLQYGVAVSDAQGKNEKFSEYSSMAAKYGAEYINQFTGVFDKYENSMNDVLKTIYEYNDALSDTKKETEELEKKNNDLAIAMAKNNIEMLKLQLIGMMRRHGNTRTEKKMMKQLEIENTQLRIQEMQNQYNADVKHNDETNSAKQTAYDEATAILNAYIDTERHNLWILMDTRDEDTQNLRDNLAEQEKLLKESQDKLKIETEKLPKQESDQEKALRDIANKPEQAAAYRAIFGQSSLDQYGGYIPGPYDMMKDLQKTGKFKIRGSYETGTDYVPSTGLYMLHKGETVSPSGGNGGGVSIGNISITIPVKTDASPQDIAAAVTMAIDSQVMKYDSTGKLSSKYRRR
jgi:TP901 family phage tail tape measure protein